MLRALSVLVLMEDDATHAHGQLRVHVGV